MTVGVSGSGKTTWANEFVSEHPSWVISCRDDIRKELYDKLKKEHPFTWDKWDWKLEPTVTSIQDKQLIDAVNDNNVEGIIITDTNLNERHRTELYSYLVNLGVKVNYMYFHCSWEDAVSRNNNRVNGVGLSVLAHQFELYYNMFSRKYAPIEDLPCTIMVSHEGTLAVNTSVESPVSSDSIKDDVVNKELSFILTAYKEKGYKILVLSNRDESCRKDIEEWYMTYVGWLPSSLYCRKTNDVRKNVTFKTEIFWSKIAYHYNVKLAVENNPSVFRSWLEIGLTTFICSNPYKEC